MEEIARRLGGEISPAVLALVKAQLVQASGLGVVTKAVESFVGFAGQYEQIEKVSAHHGNFWEVLLYGQIGRDRSVMFDLAEKLEHRDVRGRAGPGRARARDAQRECPRRVHQRPRRGRQAGRHLLRHAELAPRSACSASSPARRETAGTRRCRRPMPGRCPGGRAR